MSIEFPVLVTLADHTILGVALSHDDLLECVRSSFLDRTLMLVSDDWTTSHGRGLATFQSYPVASELLPVEVRLENVDIFGKMARSNTLEEVLL